MEKGRRNSVKRMYDPPFHAEAFLCVSSCLIFILSPCRKRVACCAEEFTTSYHIFVKKTAEDDCFLQNMILYLIKILLFCLFLTGNT